MMIEPNARAVFNVDVRPVELTNVEKLRNFVMSKTWDKKGLTGLQRMTS